MEEREERPLKAAQSTARQGRTGDTPTTTATAGNADRPPVSYRAAVLSSATSSHPKPSRMEPVKIAKKKHVPKEMKVDLLGLALMRRKEEEESRARKARLGGGTSVPHRRDEEEGTSRKGKATFKSVNDAAGLEHRPTVASANFASASDKPEELKREERMKRMVGELKPVVLQTPGDGDGKRTELAATEGKKAKRKRLSSLKRRIVRERRAVFWLNNSHVHPVPLATHPSLLEHECVWLAADALSATEGNRVETGDDDDDDDDEDEEEESDDYNDDDDKEKKTSSSNSSLDVTPKLDDAKVDGGDEDGELEEREHESEETLPVRKPTPPQTVTSFDATSISPVFFGATFVRHASVGVTTESECTTERYPPTIKRANPMREYATQAVSEELDRTICETLAALFKFQERARLEDPVKGKLRRRLVLGMHEVLRGVRSRRVKCVVVAADLEAATSLDERLAEVLQECTGSSEQDREPVEVVFVSGKKKIARSLGLRAYVSVVGIYDANGAYEGYKAMLALARRLRAVWTAAVEGERARGTPVACDRCRAPVTSFVRWECLDCGQCFCPGCAATTGKKAIARFSPCGSPRLVAAPDPTSRPPLCVTLVRVGRVPPGGIRDVVAPPLVFPTTAREEVPPPPPPYSKLNPLAQSFLPRQWG